ncbi:hypothetical protein BJ508DRAFT_415505 [Ascobolus immersus RN42]|uniref:Ecp2 effector protein domain-containing protein n=1 Tax=Ascobolus immersus RN42 TaxID=1160509 RepID=A0A3N4IEI8_ASCIM|nr:hypothetical protein BJ508DRAFT_415505 [Ascobolus immersus RN42]
MPSQLTGPLSILFLFLAGVSQAAITCLPPISPLLDHDAPSISSCVALFDTYYPANPEAILCANGGEAGNNIVLLDQADSLEEGVRRCGVEVTLETPDTNGLTDPEFCLPYEDVRTAAWNIMDDCLQQRDYEEGFVEGELVSFDGGKAVKIRTVGADEGKHQATETGGVQIGSYGVVGVDGGEVTEELIIKAGKMRVGGGGISV